jgi:DNA-binding SARP family transcriptional activator
VQLAELCSQEGDYENAINSLLRAISADSYAEHLYRRAMELYGRLGRAPDIHRIYRDLESALSEGLGASPTEETAAAKNRLIGELNKSGSK